MSKKIKDIENIIIRIFTIVFIVSLIIAFVNANIGGIMIAISII